VVINYVLYTSVISCHSNSWDSC